MSSSFKNFIRRCSRYMGREARARREVGERETNEEERRIRATGEDRWKFVRDCAYRESLLRWRHGAHTCIRCARSSFASERGRKKRKEGHAHALALLPGARRIPETIRVRMPPGVQGSSYNAGLARARCFGVLGPDCSARREDTCAAAQRPLHSVSAASPWADVASYNATVTFAR